MRAALFSALLLLVLAVTGAVLLVTYDIHQDLNAAHAVLERASATTQQLDQTMAEAKVAAGTLEAAAGEERKNWAATSLEAADTGRALRLLISRVDRSFVDGTLLHFNATTLPAIDAQVKANGDQLQITLAKLGGTADGVTAATATLNLRLGDPAIAELFAHANTISANLEVISTNSAAMSGDMKLAVHRLAQPPTKFHQFLDVTWTTAKFGSLFVP